MLRKRNDSVKPGKGIDGAEGENYTDAYNSYKGTYYKSDYPGGTKGGSEGGCGKPADERSYAGPYTTNDSGLTNVEDFQFTAGVRDITDLVEQNQDEVSYGHNAIKYGVNRSQFEGPADSNLGPSNPRRGRRS